MKTNLAQIMKNLDQFRGNSKKRISITKEQKEFLLKCRDHEQPISWEKITELWAQIGWGALTNTAIRNRYRIAKNDRT